MTSPTVGRVAVLAPDNRALLLDALRPAPGQTLDRAVATTFTLDLYDSPDDPPRIRRL